MEFRALRFALLLIFVPLLFLHVAVASPVLVPPVHVEDASVPYPKRGGGDATVLLSLLIDATGVVADVSVRDGRAPFADAATAAVKSWSFTPARRDGLPVSARILATITFHAPKETPPLPVSSELASDAGGIAPSDGGIPEIITEVAVKGEHEELGSLHIPRTEARFVPGAFGDPFRVVEALPGMSPWMSGLPYYYARGMSPENVGYFIDGIKVPLLFHVGAGPSSIAPTLVDSVDLFPAAYPARYGRFAGAVIAGESVAPNEDRAHGDFQVRLFDSEAFFETPLRDGQETALASVRYGYTGLVLAIINPNYSLSYWDYQGRISHRFGNGDHLSLFAFGSFDELENFHAPTFRVQYHRVDLRYDHALDRGNLRLGLTGNYDDALTALQTDTGAEPPAEMRGPGARARAEYEQRVGPKVLVRAGGDVSVVRFDVDSNGVTTYSPHTDTIVSAYADAVWRPSSRVELVPAFRFDGYRERGATVLAPQPRLSGKVKLLPGVSWISAFGVAHQEPTDEVLVPAKLPDPVEDVSRRSYQLSEALEAQLPASFQVRATGYVTLLHATDGTAREESRGLEFFLRRALTERLGGFVSYTLSKTTDTLGGESERAAGDSRHLLSVVLGYDMGRGWRVGGRFFYRSGRPYLLNCATADCSAGESARTYTVSGQLPSFYRVDARVEKRWTFGGGKWLAGVVEVFNATDRAEVTSVNYTPQTGIANNVQSAIILPSIGVEGGF